MCSQILIPTTIILHSPSSLLFLNWFLVRNSCFSFPWSSVLPLMRELVSHIFGRGNFLEGEPATVIQIFRFLQRLPMTASQISQDIWHYNSKLSWKPYSWCHNYFLHTAMPSHLTAPIFSHPRTTWPTPFDLPSQPGQLCMQLGCHLQKETPVGICRHNEWFAHKALSSHF